MKFHTEEWLAGHHPVTAHHSSYLEALLYVVKRSNGGAKGETRVFQDGECVKCYTHPRYPSAEEVISAVKHPERTREFKPY